MTADTQSAAQVLRAARELLSDPARWTKGAWAEDGAGMEVSPVSPNAVCWCVEGALMRVSGVEVVTAVGFALEALANVVGDIAWYNDAATTQFSDILTALDRAIALAESTK